MLMNYMKKLLCEKKNQRCLLYVYFKFIFFTILDVYLMCQLKANCL